MVLDNLGERLRDALKKITKIGFVDKKAVIELSADIKKALISGDVNVRLAKDLAKKIRDRALKEKPAKGLTTREHVINIVFEELTNFLGKEPGEVKIKKKPTILLLVGLFGSGKCVHPESQILLADGRILSAKELYERLAESPEKIEDGEISDVSNKNIFLPSFNPKTLKIENKKLTHVWKLSGKKLLKIYLDNGNDFNVRVTPEHPFFILRRGKIKQVRAEELTEEDFVAVPREYKYAGKQINLFPELKILDLNIKETPYKLVKELPYKRNYCKFTANLKRGVVPISLIREPNSSLLKIRYKDSQKFITFPKYLTCDLAEFLGYIIGDGYITERCIQIFTENREIVKRVKFLSRSLFTLDVNIRKDAQRKELHVITISSKTLAIILNKLFKIPFGKKGPTLRVPPQIFCSELDTIRQFIKAYFDCDAFVSKLGREIEIVSESGLLIKDISLLLLRFGIISSIWKKEAKKKKYSRLFLRARYAESYAEKIGFRVHSKSERAKKFKQIGVLQGCGKQDMIPVGDILKNIRISLGFSIGELQNRVASYGLYESKGWISRESLFKMCQFIREKERGNIFRILSSINRGENIWSKFSNSIVNGALQMLINTNLVVQKNRKLYLTKNALHLIANKSIESLNYLERLASSDICWFRVSKIETIEAPKYVYDFTVEDNHSFIADGFIVHNTTTSGKLAKYYKKRGYKIALVQTDTWRPAAYAQLKQLAGALKVDFFGDEKERDPVKIVRKFRQKFGKYDLVIVDSAGRDALNKELIEEIRALSKELKADEVLLVLSGDVGQGAEKQARAFHDACGITGIIITKLDGTAKGGGALSACAISGAKVKFIGIGEKLDALEEFKPKNFVSRLLGMGDLETLLKKAEEAIDKEKAEKVAKKVVKGETLSLQDLYEQLEALKKMGPLSQILTMIPGLGAAVPKEFLKDQEKNLQVWKYIMDSMTPQEKENPEIINASRIKRIAKGSGRSEREVRELLKQWKMMKKMTKALGSGRQMKQLERLMKSGKLKGLKFGV